MKNKYKKKYEDLVKAIEKLTYYHSILNQLNQSKLWIGDKIAFESLKRLYLLSKGDKDYFGEDLTKEEIKKLYHYCKCPICNKNPLQVYR